MMSCSDQNLDTVIELAKHAEQAGADYIVVHAPMLHFGHNVDATVRGYYEYIASQVNIGVVMWSHPDAGYLLSPETCARIAADCHNVVAIKYSVPREMYAELTNMTRDSLIVSTASEAEWLDNIIELGWRLYLCSSHRFCFRRRWIGACRNTRSWRSKAASRKPESARQPRAGSTSSRGLTYARHAPMPSRNTGRIYWDRSAAL